jgi:regulator of protease activity HflC (stomatin/prohibitin superfamily)
MRSPLALLGWVIFSLAAAAIGYWLHGGLGLVLAVVVSQAAFWLGLIAASQFLFAMPSGSDRLAAFWSLLGWLLGSVRPCYLVQDGEAELRIEGSPWGFGPGVLLVDSASAVVLESSHGRPSHVYGPGTHFVQLGESVRGTVDLRPQSRRREVRAMTRDGIYVDSSVSVTFYIEPGESEPGAEAPFPFAADAVLRAVYETPVGQQDIADWGDAVAALAADQLRTILARYRLDELYMPSNPALDPRRQIKDELVTRTRSAAEGLGVRIRSVNFGVPQPPVGVTEQRVRSWQAKWASQVLETYAEGEARALEHMERARAQAQLEMVKGITRGFDQLAESGTPIPRELVVLRFIEALERMVADPQTRELVPGDTLRELAAFIKIPGEEEGPPPPPGDQPDTEVRVKVINRPKDQEDRPR